MSIELLGKKFMYLGMEYEVVFINEKAKRLNVEPLDKTKKLPMIGQKIVIDVIPFVVTYIHETKNRITLSPIVPDDFLINNNKGDIPNE